jgi:hypothetical protein
MEVELKPKKAAWKPPADAFTEPVILEDAWKELSAGAFGVWIILHTLSKKKLARGYYAMAEHFGYSRRRLQDLIAELESKEYIAREVRTDDTHVKAIFLLRRAMIKGQNAFVKLS